MHLSPYRVDEVEKRVVTKNKLPFFRLGSDIYIYT